MLNKQHKVLLYVIRLTAKNLLTTNNNQALRTSFVNKYKVFELKWLTLTQEELNSYLITDSSFVWQSWIESNTET